MKRTFTIFVLICMLAVSCNNNDKDKAMAKQCAENFSKEYFNFKYVDAMKYTTGDSKRVLQFCASNMSQQNIDSLKNVTDTPTINVSHLKIIDDSTGTFKVNVDNGIYFDTIGGNLSRDKHRTFCFNLSKSGGKWKVRMEDLPRSER